MAATPHLTLVLGGTRSGKSEVAESLAARASDAGTDRVPVTYVATGGAGDPADESWAARVAAHRLRRPSHWGAIDLGPGDELGGLVAELPGVVLIDSLGSWLATRATLDLDAASASELASSLAARLGTTIVVSEEVGLAVHPPTPAGRAFTDSLGLLNAAVASAAHAAVLVVAGRCLDLATAPAASDLDRWLP